MRTIYKVAAFSFFVFAVSLLILLNKCGQHTGKQCIADNSLPADALEYHFLAANFALNNQFPVLGFISDTNDYKVCTTNASAPVIDMLKQNGPVVLLSRPPLYPLLLGVVFKQFGVNNYYTYVINAFVIALLIALLPLAGYLLWNTNGLLTGIAIGGYYLIRGDYYLNHHNVENLTTLIAMVVFMAGVYAHSRKKWHCYLLLGIAIAAGALIKGIFVLVLPLFLLFALAKVKSRTHQYFVQSVALVAGFVVVLLPWVVYINQQKAESQTARAEWVKKLWRDLPEVSGNTREELVASPGIYPIVNDYLMRVFYRHYVTDYGFMVITNQTGGEALLNVNNEYCTDGDLHPEWSIIRTSYYNTHHADKGPAAKVALFYIENLGDGIKIILAKYLNSTGRYPLFLWLSAGLWGLYNILLCIKAKPNKPASVVFFVCVVLFVFATFVPVHWSVLCLFVVFFVAGIVPSYFAAGKLPVIIPAFILNMLAIVLITYGDVRFISVTAPVAALCSAYLLFLVIRRLQRLYMGSN